MSGVILPTVWMPFIILCCISFHVGHILHAFFASIKLSVWADDKSDSVDLTDQSMKW